MSLIGKYSLLQKKKCFNNLKNTKDNQKVDGDVTRQTRSSVGTNKFICLCVYIFITHKS